jgi:4-aminobutyrate aminotransferase-like enzyme
LSWRSAGRDNARQGSQSAFISETLARKAIEAAIKLARYHTKRDKLIAFYGASMAARWARFR